MQLGIGDCHCVKHFSGETALTFCWLGVYVNFSSLASLRLCLPTRTIFL